ncbi:MAG TPA: hypothetical protein VF845_12520 [Terriglobales bacterium]
MSYKKTIPFLLAPLLLAASALAQTGDWQAVKDLQPGTRISVRSDHLFIHNTCFFLSATDDQLVCERAVHSRRRMLIPPLPPEAIYERSRVREVRLEHSEGANTMAGAGIGAGIGAALGASTNNGTLTRGGGALLLGGIGALVGGSFGSEFPVIHGKVVYRR